MDEYGFIGRSSLFSWQRKDVFVNHGRVGRLLLALFILVNLLSFRFQIWDAFAVEGGLGFRIIRLVQVGEETSVGLAN